MSAPTKSSVKVIMVGAPKAGKTALLQRYNELDFEPLYIPTSAGDFSVKDVKIDSVEISAQIWDIGGSGVLGKSFLRGTHGVILTVDLTSKASMKVLDNVYDRVKQLVGFADDAFPCILVGTKLDLIESGGTREISTEDLNAWAKKKRPNSADPVAIFEVSAKDGTNVATMFESILRWAKNKPGKIGPLFGSPAPAVTPSGPNGVPASPVGKGGNYNYAQAVMNGDNNSVVDQDKLSFNGEAEESDQAVAKVVLAGSVSVGKTFLLQRFVGDDKDINSEGHYEPTVGADLRIVDMPVRDRNLTLQIWDTSGNPKMINIGRSIYKDSDCLILVYDITSRESFHALDTFWDSYIAYAQPPEPDDFPVLLVGNKTDLNDRRAVPLEEVLDWCTSKRPRKPITYYGELVYSYSRIYNEYKHRLYSGE
jgi:small GTP-binding protein